MTFDDHRWEGYVDAFHAASPGITEHVLGRARAEGTDPYRWCAAALGRTGELVADVACGSGPLAAHLPRWVGVDTSAAELDAAAARGRSPVARADVLELPLATRSLDAVVCSMGLQVTEPLPDVLAEIARVLRPGGIALVYDLRPFAYTRRELEVFLAGSVFEGARLERDLVRLGPLPALFVAIRLARPAEA